MKYGVCFIIKIFSTAGDGVTTDGVTTAGADRKAYFFVMVIVCFF
jgi:hypothetical protein